MAIGIWITVPESNVHINSQEQICTLDHLGSELQALCSGQVVQKCYHTVGYLRMLKIPLNMQSLTEI
jgi:hypothetical protein